jgi:hypothetical protein
VGVLPVRGTRLPRPQDLGEAPRPAGHDRRLPAACRTVRLPPAPRRHRRRTPPQGTIKSAVAFGILLAEGIGDTLRVSLSAPPVREIGVGFGILESLGLRTHHLESCPAPAADASQSDSAASSTKSNRLPHPCNGKGLIFIKGHIVATVLESKDRRNVVGESVHTRLRQHRTSM